MLVSDIINNPNFDTEFEWRINLVNDDFEVVKTYELSKCEEIPFDIMVKQVCYMTIGSCFVENRNTNTPCLIIEVNV